MSFLVEVMEQMSSSAFACSTLPMTMAALAFRCFHFVVCLLILELWCALSFFLGHFSAISCQVARSPNRSCFRSYCLLQVRHPYLYSNSISIFLQTARSPSCFSLAEILRKEQSASQAGPICYRVSAHHKKPHRQHPELDTILTPSATALLLPLS